MIDFLNKMINENKFVEISDYDRLIELLKKDFRINRLIRNYLYLLRIDIPEDFLEKISSDNKLYLEIQMMIPGEYEKLGYFAEAPMLLSIEEYYNQYCYLNDNKKSPLLYHINIINYSVFCVKYNSIIFPSILQALLENIIVCLTTYNYSDILQLYKKYVSLYFILQEGNTESEFPIFKGGSPRSESMEKWFELSKNIFLYFSFNQINQVKLSYFQFTNIIFASINIEKPTHSTIRPLYDLILHDIYGHEQIERVPKITDLESYRLFRFLLFIDKNQDFKDLSYAPWLFFHEYRDAGFGGSERIFNLFDLPKNILNSLTMKDYNYTYKCALKLLYFLNLHKIISLNENIRLIITEYQSMRNLIDIERYKLLEKINEEKCKPMYKINDYIWKLRLKEQPNDDLCDEDLFIENIPKSSIPKCTKNNNSINQINLEFIKKFKKKASVQAIKIYEYPDNRKKEAKVSENFFIIDYHKKYLSYKNKYLKLKL